MMRVSYSFSRAMATMISNSSRRTSSTMEDEDIWEYKSFVVSK